MKVSLSQPALSVSFYKGDLCVTPTNIPLNSEIDSGFNFSAEVDFDNSQTPDLRIKQK
ncbi:hypothetical protein HMPREF1981_03601 [Bacteroides pyogenes F0041]|uniref:Uncharacterized protein n=1 Tax=Bacteroides pyogenes F0041 TaxID=1321819 RepID=U2DH62_9BACE|nr:hypothetical protein HMPREF1981_03601 [Bacteroides pyogenes F0041]